MSHYTTEVRYICENYAGLDKSAGYDSVDQILSASAPKVFSFNYPIFDENYRTILEKKILKHYYTREICAETVGLWKLWLDARMNEIMPYYNQLYESELIEFNPMYNADYTTERHKENEGEENGITSNRKNGTNAMTGTIVDDGQDVLKQTGTIGKEGAYDEAFTGDVKDTGDVTEVKDSNIDTTKSNTTGFSEEIDNTGTDTTVRTGSEQRTDNLSENKSTHDKLDRWDYYNDTPQGGIDGVEDLEYLTNVRHITEDGTGSGGTTTNTGTQTKTYNNVTDAETKNLKTETDSERTENEQVGVEEDTTNTTTKNLKREYDTDKAGTTEDTTTYDKTDTKDMDNTRTFNTLNTISDTENGTDKTTITNMEDYTEHVIGKFPDRHSYSRLLKEFRETFLNIDAMIISDLSDLFMLIY